MNGPNECGYCNTDHPSSKECPASATPPPAAARPRVEVGYSPAEGIVLRGTTREMGPNVKKVRGWKWYRAGNFWYVQRTRDTVQSRTRIERHAEELRVVLPGVEVVVVFEAGELRPAEEREADQKERLEQRAERLEDRADRLGDESAARYAAGKRIADGIPMGQPILVGHHSEKRHRRDLARINSNFDKAHELAEERKGDLAAAKSALRTVKRLDDVPSLLRRRERLSAERRSLEKNLREEKELAKDWTSGCVRKIVSSSFRKISPAGSDEPTTYWDLLSCGHRLPYTGDPDQGPETNGFGEGPGPTERPCKGCQDGIKVEGRENWIAAAELRLAAAIDELGLIAKKLEGVDLPGPQRYAKGQEVPTQHGRAIVLRVNPKGLTVKLIDAPHLPECMRTFKATYDRLLEAEKRAKKGGPGAV